MGLHVTWVRQLNVDQLNFVFDIFKILFLEAFVLEEEVLTSLILNRLAKAIQVVIIQLSAQDILIDLLAKFHHFLEILHSDVVFTWIGLGHHEHLIVLLPELDKVGVFLNDEVYNVQRRQDFTKVIENDIVYQLFKAILIHFILSLEQTIHLVHDVQGQIDNSSNNIEKLIVHFQSPADLKLLFATLACLFLFEDETRFTKKDQGVIET